MIRRICQLFRNIAPRSNSGTRYTFESKLNFRTRNFALYQQALRHSSVDRHLPNNWLRSYERLEFLGDAVLGCVVAEHLYTAFPSEMEGFLTLLRAKLVSKPACARVARALDLGTLVQLSPELEARGGRNSDSILADCLEAIIGAVYLDQGMTAARSFVYQHMLKDVDLDKLAAKEDNHKSRLLEYAQARGWEHPVYKTLETSGPGHKRIFTVEVHLHGHSHGVGQDDSKKKAEQRAAHEALTALRSQTESNAS